MNGQIYHQDLASGRWFKMSLAEQMGNIGSEVSRAKNWQGKDDKLFWGAVGRGLELFNLTISDKRWGDRRKELCRAYEIFCDAVLGGKVYNSDFESLCRYFDYFALLATKNYGK